MYRAMAISVIPHSDPVTHLCDSSIDFPICLHAESWKTHKPWPLPLRVPTPVGGTESCKQRTGRSRKLDEGHVGRWQRRINSAWINSAWRRPEKLPKGETFLLSPGSLYLAAAQRAGGRRCAGPQRVQGCCLGVVAVQGGRESQARVGRTSNQTEEFGQGAGEKNLEKSRVALSAQRTEEKSQWEALGGGRYVLRVVTVQPGAGTLGVKSEGEPRGHQQEG